MPSYSTNLKTWGSTGSEYPDSYSYVEGEQPVDEWDNFLTSNLINDVQHLIGATNDDLIAKDGTEAMEAALPVRNTSFPSGDEFRVAPDEGSASDGDEALDIRHYDSSANTTTTILEAWADGTVNVSNGDLKVNGNTVYDYSAGHIPQSSVQQGSGSALNADTVDGYEATRLMASISDSGSEVLSNPSDINFGNNLSVVDDADGTVTVDTSNYTDSDAISAINSDSDHGSTASHNYFSGSHNDLSNVAAGDHRSDSNVVTTVESAGTLAVNISGDADTVDNIEGQTIQERDLAANFILS